MPGSESILLTVALLLGQAGLAAEPDGVEAAWGGQWITAGGEVWTILLHGPAWARTASLHRGKAPPAAPEPVLALRAIQPGPIVKDRFRCRHVPLLIRNLPPPDTVFEVRMLRPGLLRVEVNGPGTRFELIRHAAATRPAQTTDSQLPDLRRRAGQAEPLSRLAAARELAAIDDDAAGPILRALAEDDSSVVAIAAARALLARGDAQAPDRLARMLFDPRRSDVQSFASAWLGAHPGAAVDALLAGVGKLAGSSRQDRARELCGVLGVWGDKALPVWRSILAQPDPELREALLKAAGQTHPPMRVAGLAALLRAHIRRPDSDSTHRRVLSSEAIYALRLLAVQQDPDTLDLMLAHWKHIQPHRWQWLGPEAIEPIVRKLVELAENGLPAKGPGATGEPRALLGVLYPVGARHPARLAEAVTGLDDRRVRHWIHRYVLHGLVANRRNGPLVAFIRPDVRSDVHGDRILAAWSLRNIHTEEARALLAILVGDERSTARLMAARALVQGHPEHALGILRDHLARMAAAETYDRGLEAIRVLEKVEQIEVLPVLALLAESSDTSWAKAADHAFRGVWWKLTGEDFPKVKTPAELAAWWKRSGRALYLRARKARPAQPAKPGS